MALHDIAFPFRIDSTGLPAVAKDDQAILGMIRLLMGTAPGELEGRPTYGADLWRFVFENLGGSAASLIHAEFADAVETWLPFVRIVGVASRRSEDGITYDVTYDHDGSAGAFQLTVGT